jgi:hypothetical protein
MTIYAIGQKVPYVYEGFELKFDVITNMIRDDEDDEDLCCYEMEHGDMVTGYEIRQAQKSVSKLTANEGWQMADITITVIGVIVSTGLLIWSLWYAGVHW